MFDKNSKNKILKRVQNDKSENISWQEPLLEACIPME